MVRETNRDGSIPAFAAMIAVAVGGSMFFGWTLGLALHADLLGSALWLTVGAASGWAALIPSLVSVSRLPWSSVIYSCLVAICYGEGVLCLGGLGNLAGLPILPTLYNSVVVLISNIVMAATLSGQLKERGVEPWKTLALWFLVLDGVGALAFWGLRFLLG